MKRALTVAVGGFLAGLLLCIPFVMSEPPLSLPQGLPVVLFTFLAVEVLHIFWRS